MTTTTTPKTLNIGDVDAIALVFDWHGRELVVEADRSADTLDFWKTYGHVDRAMDSYGLDDDGAFFVFYVADCFAPPLYVVRGRTFEDAYETFCDEFSRLIAIDADTLPDYLHEHTCPNFRQPEGTWIDCECTKADRINYSSSGVAIETESIQGAEITLSRVICAVQGGRS